MGPTTAGDDVVPNGKTGTLVTAVAHVFCAIVGAGVLGLPNSVAWLGWVAGPLCLIVFFAIALWGSLLLARLYRVGNLEFSRYHHLVEHVLGRKGAIAISVFQLLGLVLSDIAYSITGASALQTVANLIGSSFNKDWQLVLLMGAMELVFSQVPSLEKIWWVSLMGSISSLGYVLIALTLGLIYSGNHLGEVGGRPGTSDANKAFGMLNALGNIAFAFGFAQVLLEIQDTLRQPPRAERTMTSAVYISVTAAFGFYLSTAVACYSALGNAVPGQVLEGFDEAPNWVLVVANICIYIHMVTAWQVWAQPVFETVESNIKAWSIRRQQKAAGHAAPVQLVGAAGSVDGEVKGGEVGKPSPFDAHHSQPSNAAQHSRQHPPEAHHLAPLAEAASGGDVERGASLALNRDGSSLRVRMSARSSGALVVLNSAPIPDLLPVKGWNRRPNASLASLDKDGAADASASNLRRRSVLARATTALGSQAMYHVDTGAANEHVPLNDQGYYLPLWQRLIVRSIYVLLCTLVAACIPFFGAVVGLVGAITFWPMSIGFPFLMTVKVYKTTGPTLWLMKTVALVMLLVCIAATVASVQSIIVSWSTYTFFS